MKNNIVLHTYLPMKMEQTECSETSAYKIQTPENYPEGNTQEYKNTIILRVPAYEDGTECSETSAYKIQTPGNYPDENIQHSQHGESLKSRNLTYIGEPTKEIKLKASYL
jgi:hypothetical protein